MSTEYQTQPCTRSAPSTTSAFPDQASAPDSVKLAELTSSQSAQLSSDWLTIAAADAGSCEPAPLRSVLIAASWGRENRPTSALGLLAADPWEPGSGLRGSHVRSLSARPSWYALSRSGVSANSSRIAWLSSDTAARSAAAENAVPPPVAWPPRPWPRRRRRRPLGVSGVAAAAASPSDIDSAATAAFSLSVSRVTAAPAWPVWDTTRRARSARPRERPAWRPVPGQAPAGAGHRRRRTAGAPSS